MSNDPGTVKVVINAQHGGFSVNRTGWLWLKERGQVDALKQLDPLRPQDPDEDDRWYTLRKKGGFDADMLLRYITRTDPLLIEMIETLGSAAVSGELATLKIVEIPAGVAWEIEEYDGLEWVAESHRTWS